MSIDILVSQQRRRAGLQSSQICYLAGLDSWIETSTVIFDQTL